MLSILTSSIKIQPAWLFLSLLTTKDLEPKYTSKMAKEKKIGWWNFCRVKSIRNIKGSIPLHEKKP